MWIFGIVLLIVALSMGVKYQHEKKKIALMTSVDPSEVAALKELTEDMRAGVGRGSLQYQTEVNGRVVCQNPLKSELAGVECVYYSMRVDRHYEETYYERDQNGRSRRRTRRGYESVSANTRSVPFEVEDESGRIRINPERAEIIPEQVLSDYQAENSLQDRQLRRGGYQYRLPQHGHQQTNPRTLGYRYIEAAIPVNDRVYINGEASDTSGQLQIQSPAEEGRFIISVKDERALVEATKRAMRSTLIWAILAAAGGVVVFVLGLGA